jgi:hypothetical protein
MRVPTIFMLVLLPLFSTAQTVDEVSVYASGGKSVTTWHGQAAVASLNIEFAHSVSPRTDVGFIFSPTSINQPRSWFGDDYGDGDEDVRALGGSLFVRRKFLVKHERMHLFAELSSGPMWAERRVPASTSRFNFASQAAAGFIFMPHRAMPVTVGYRFMHISNGGYAPRNPGLNVSSIMIGTVLRLRR